MHDRHAMPKGITAIIAMTTLVVATPVSAFASTAGSASANTASAKGSAAAGQIQQPKLSPKQAEAIVRTTFSIPPSYQVQNESFRQAQPGSPNPVSTYTINFAPADQTTPGVTYYAILDANTGRIVSYNLSNPGGQAFQFPVPTSLQEAENIALAWARKLYPNQLPQTKLIEAPAGQNSLRSPVSYQFSFERVINGITAPFNGFSMTIDQHGQLSQVQDSWSKMSFPTSTAKLSQAAANQVYKHALSLHLDYSQVWNPNGQSTNVLGYQPSSDQTSGYWNMQFNSQYNVVGPVINAASGSWVNPDGSMASLAPYKAPVPLVTGGPTQDPDQNSVNWSEQQALSYAAHVIQLPSGAKLMTANQWQAQKNDETWQFSWQTADGQQYNVTVDATHGFLQNYNQWTIPPAAPSAATGSAKQALTGQELEKFANNFVQRVLPHDTGAVTVTAVAQPANIPITNSPANFQITVLVHGIPNQMESGSVTLNRDTGQVTGFYFNIGSPTNSQLPSPAQVIAKSTAQDIWVANHPLQLMYLLTSPTPAWYGKLPASPSQNQTSPKAVLVYAPTSPTNLGVFNAITGRFETSGQPTPYSGQINDLAGVSQAPQIQLLVQRGLLSVDANGDVHPQQAMTTSAFIKLLMDSLGLTQYYSSFSMQSSAGASAMANVSSSSPNYHEIMAAYAIGLIPLSSPFQPNAVITRSQAAQWVARALGLEPLLSQPQAFNFNPADRSQIQTPDLAADALTVTLGIFRLNNNNFNPNGPVTLAEAAAAVVQTANVGAQMNVTGPVRVLP